MRSLVRRVKNDQRREHCREVRGHAPPQNFGNLDPLKSTEILPILLTTAKRQSLFLNFSRFFLPFCTK